jgi:PAS domain-containing protein
VQLDITELKVVEDELRAARDELERRVAERTAALEEANALMALEIGERRRAEEDLRAAEHRYRVLAEQIPAVTYVWDADPAGGEPPQTYTSPRIEQLLGYAVAEWHSARNFALSRLHPDDHADVGRRWSRRGHRQPVDRYRYPRDGRIVVASAILLRGF